jgi:hypothetical protein
MKKKTFMVIYSLVFTLFLLFSVNIMTALPAIVNPISSVEILPANAIVNVNQTVQFTAVVNGGVPPYTISWGFQKKVDDQYQGGSYSYTSSSTTYTFMPTSAGTYVVYFFLRDSLNQTATTFSPSVVTVLSPTASASFSGSLGDFTIISPTNTTYNSNILNLNVTGRIIAVNTRLTMNYSLDGQNPIPFPIQTYIPNPDFQYIGAINGSIILPQLTNGPHNLTAYADLEAAGTHLAQATVWFTINAQPTDTSTPSPIPTNTSTPTPSPSISNTPTQSPTITENPTIAPTMIPSSSPMGPYSPTDPYIILIPILIAVVAVIATLVYVKKNKRNSDTP